MLYSIAYSYVLVRMMQTEQDMVCVIINPSGNFGGFNCSIPYLTELTSNNTLWIGYRIVKYIQHTSYRFEWRIRQGNTTYLRNEISI